jgi:multiple sugar transport system substrate-binding protein
MRNTLKALGLVVLLTLAGVALAQDTNWWTEAARPFVGTVLHGISESTPPSRHVSEVLARRFEELTGIRIVLELTSWDMMYTKSIADMEAGTGVYDFVYIEQDIIYAYLARNFLVDITQTLADNPNLVAPGVNFGDFTTFIDYFKDDRGHLFGVPMEAFVKPYLYRKDLFEDPEIQAAFRERFGYNLAPATTFAQYRDIAEFFTEWGREHRVALWGSTVQAHTGHPASTYEVLETIFPSFGIFNWGINMDTMKATEADGGMLNSDRAKEALAFWVGMLEFAPPESVTSTWDEVAATFAAGRAAQGWVYGENTVWVATDPARSLVVGKVGVALPPTYEGVMADAEARRGYIGYYDGGAFGVPHSSRNKEAALLWLQFLALADIQTDWAMAGGRITHTATFDDPRIVELDAKVGGYFTLMRDKGHLFAGAPPFPFHAPVREVIDAYIRKAITGELTAEEALDQAAVAVNEELVRLGFAR